MKDINDYTNKYIKIVDDIGKRYILIINNNKIALLCHIIILYLNYIIFWVIAINILTKFNNI